jgi:hypothetical protein
MVWSSIVLSSVLLALTFAEPVIETHDNALHIIAEEVLA